MVVAQSPTNDNCNAATPINITNNGFNLGTFVSSSTDITNATVETSETFAPAILVAGQNKKSLWYKFTLPTTRSVRVALDQQGSAITAGEAGFAVYRTNNCLPANTDISTKLTPISTFGKTYHPCVEAGSTLSRYLQKMLLTDQYLFSYKYSIQLVQFIIIRLMHMILVL